METQINVKTCSPTTTKFYFNVLKLYNGVYHWYTHLDKKGIEDLVMKDGGQSTFYIKNEDETLTKIKYTATVTIPTIH